ncbi:hypothetical protein BRM57_00790, partial [Xanthomonas oryzae pv. oryzae]
MARRCCPIVGATDIRRSRSRLREHDRNELHAIRTQLQHAVRRYRHRLVRERGFQRRRRPAGRRH